MNLSFLFLISVFLNEPIFAAKPSLAKISQHAQETDSELLAFLSLPEEMLIRKISTLNKNQQSFFSKIAFDINQPINIRWRALLIGSKLNHQMFAPEIEKARLSSEWFMRTAAIESFAGSPSAEGMQLARSLIQDKALVVRTAAADHLMTSQSEKDREVLWSSIQDKINIRKGKSLWIRGRIMKHLTSSMKSDEYIKFVGLLKDPDVEIQRQALAALDQSSALSFGITGSTPEVRKSKWISWGESYRAKQN